MAGKIECIGCLRITIVTLENCFCKKKNTHKFEILIRKPFVIYILTLLYKDYKIYPKLVLELKYMKRE